MVPVKVYGATNGIRLLVSGRLDGVVGASGLLVGATRRLATANIDLIDADQFGVVVLRRGEAGFTGFAVQA